MSILVQTPEGQPASSGMTVQAPSVQTTTAVSAGDGNPPAAPAGDGNTGNATGQPQKSAPPGGCGGQDPMFSFILLGVMFVVFYLFLIRPQQKRQKELQGMLNSLDKGDRVITSGGVLGTIVGINDQIITLEVADKVKIKVMRSHVQGKQPGTVAPSEGDKKKKNNDKESGQSDS